MNKPLAIDLFCGAGGMSEGILQAGFHIIYSSDINESVQATYTSRHLQLGYIQGKNTHFELADIKELTGEGIRRSIENLEIFRSKKIPPIDAIFGGPPCQGFSRAGQRKKDDPRNFLFREYLRIVDEIRPKYVVMENVEGFLDTKLYGFEGVKKKKYADDVLLPEILLEEFEEIGYHTLKPKVLDASDYGVPQRRRRVIFIAYLHNQVTPLYPRAITAEEGQKISVLDAFGDLIINPDLRIQFNPEDTSYQIQSKIGRTPNFNGISISNFNNIHNHEISKHNSLIIQRFSLYRQGESSSMLIKRILEEGLDLERYPYLLQECARRLHKNYTVREIIDVFRGKNLSEELLEALLTKKNSRIRLSSTSLAPTMVTLPDDFLSPFEDRILTVREMARLQSFDDSFVFLGKRTTGGQRRKFEVPQYTQVGNAVPPLLARAIAEKIIEAINTPRESLTSLRKIKLHGINIVKEKVQSKHLGTKVKLKKYV
ncbi:DNA cytosine methyltransferase [Heliorestis convoluta]|uniref:Cytosine-specific methyltransferase n=1 Tax=Heliorestis convoluta TaxID=356322 RepID=A0A5Q2N1E0_9FIRM|nr:DNA cytosine methyltransferase [Heliorestis convoluta]QGG47633.1 DNA (cytosine-5-)-methyltransferase [Heliorestis convoluta]